MKFTKENLPKIIGIACGVLAFILAIFLDGSKITQTESNITMTMRVNLLGVMFGGSKIKASTMGVELSVPFTGGLSVFGFISFLAMIIGVALLVASIFVKNDKFEVAAFCLLFVAGVTVFLILVAGENCVCDYTELGGGSMSMSFTEFYEGCHLGVGVYIYAAFCLFASIFGFINYYNKKKAL